MGYKTPKHAVYRRRGATFIELALVLLPLLALLLAILDFGFAIFLRSTFQHAVREGVRYAVTSRTEAGYGHDASIKRVVQTNALGFLAGETGASKIHIRYFVPGTLVETQSNAGGNIVEVSVEGYTWSWMAPVLRNALPPMTINSRSSDRMEPSPGGIPPPR
jgi:Flp pilus assembly protein TadG